MDDFDDFDLSSGFDDPADQDIENQSDSELGDFASEASEGLTQDKADFKRTALTIIAIGVILLLLVLSFMRMFGGGKKKPADTPVNNNQTVVNNEVTQPSTNSYSDGWISIDKTDIAFSEEYVSAKFLITGIEHVARVVDEGNNLEIKTILTGSISGYTGTYKLDIPYYLGCQLVTEKSFDVQVQVGKFNGKTVIGNIKY